MMTYIGGSLDVKNAKTLDDTHATRAQIESAAGQVQMKEVMLDKTPGRYMVKAIMAGFLLAIVTVFMFAVKTQFAGTNDGLVNLLGAIAFSLALVLIVLTNSELLTSNFMYLTVGWYYKVISMSKIMKVITFCFIGNIIGGIFYFS